MQEQFISLLKLRVTEGIGWEGAKSLFNDKQGRGPDHVSKTQKSYQQEHSSDKILSEDMHNDHLADSKDDRVLSFP